MSGVIDSKGQQWEHCNLCNEFVRFPENLGYQPKSKTYPHGRMICMKCTNKLSQWHLSRVQAAPDWIAKRG